jgi:hypothetical protein
MPIFDRSASRPGRAEADLLEGVLGLASTRSPSVRPLPREERRRQRRASIMRASVVLALLGLFCGSAVVMSEKLQPPPGAAPALPPAAAHAPVRAHAKAWPALPASGSPDEMTYCLWSEDPGEALAAKRLVADAYTNPGALHGRTC